jgi:hypothetical protein
MSKTGEGKGKKKKKRIGDHGSIAAREPRLTMGQLMVMLQTKSLCREPKAP